MIHTSGTTGVPKGALLGQAAQMATGVAMARDGDLNRTDRGLISQPLFHVGAKFLQLALHSVGASVHLFRQFDPDAIWKAVTDRQITVLQVVPTMLEDLLDRAEQSPGTGESLKTIYYSTAPIRTELLERALERFGPILVQEYGSTEAGLVSSLLKHQHLPNDRRLSSAGRPVTGVSVRIVDEDGAVCAVDRVGEIEVRHPNIFLGYWNDDDATTDVMHDDWLRMGDMGRLSDGGFLTIVDRKRDMIISGGENVYPREVGKCAAPASTRRGSRRDWNPRLALGRGSDGVRGF